MNNSLVAAYFKTMVNSAIFLGADQNFAEKEMLEVLEFEATLCSYLLPFDVDRNITLLHNIMNIDEIQKLAPSIDWNRLIAELIGTNVTSSDEIIVNAPKSLPQLNNLLQTTNKR